MKFRLGKQGGRNFVGFSKSSLEISPNLVWRWRSNIFKKCRVCRNKYHYKKINKKNKRVILQGFSFIWCVCACEYIYIYIYIERERERERERKKVLVG